jgi:GTP-binding protein
MMLMMDIRHPLKEFDKQMVLWANQAELPVHILLTKADKLKRGAARNTLLDVQKKLDQDKLSASVQLFSSHNREGRDDAINKLDEWFDLVSDS